MTALEVENDAGRTTTLARTRRVWERGHTVVAYKYSRSNGCYLSLIETNGAFRVMRYFFIGGGACMASIDLDTLDERAAWSALLSNFQ